MGSYSAIGFGGNFLTVLPGIDTVVTVLADSAATPLSNDELPRLDCRSWCSVVLGDQPDAGNRTGRPRAVSPDEAQCAVVAAKPASRIRGHRMPRAIPARWRRQRMATWSSARQHSVVDRAGIRRAVAGAGNQGCESPCGTGPAQCTVTVAGPTGRQDAGEHIAGAGGVEWIHTGGGNAELRAVAAIAGAAGAEGGHPMGDRPKPLSRFGFIDDQDIDHLCQLQPVPPRRRPTVTR